MLKKYHAFFVLTVLVIVSSCTYSGHQHSYCNKITKSEVSIDFDKKIVSVGSRGSLDQIYPIIPCGKGAETCFMSLFDFVNPFLQNPRDNPNLKLSRTRGKNIEVILEYKRKRTRYELSPNDRLPKKFTVGPEEREDIFEQC